MNDQQFKLLMDKFDILTKVTVMSALQNKSLKEQVQTLHSVGMPISEISKLLDRRMTDLGQYLYRKPQTKVKSKSKLKTKSQTKK